MSKRAILVVDMLNDFVTGALKCDRGLAIVPTTAELLRGAREKMCIRDRSRRAVRGRSARAG